MKKIICLLIGHRWRRLYNYNLTCMAKCTRCLKQKGFLSFEISPSREILEYDKGEIIKK